MAVEKRKGGIAFRMDGTFDYNGQRIPETELLKLAESINFTKFIKMRLAELLIARRQHNAQQHAITHNNTTK